MAQKDSNVYDIDSPKAYYLKGIYFLLMLKWFKIE